MNWKFLLPTLLLEVPDLVLKLPRPPSVNSAYVNLPKGGRAKSKSYIKWLNASKAELWSQKLKFFDGNIVVIYEIPRTRKIMDCANYEKLASDFLVKTGIIKDDSLIDINIQTWSQTDKLIINIYKTY